MCKSMSLKKNESGRIVTKPVCGRPRWNQRREEPRAASGTPVAPSEFGRALEDLSSFRGKQVSKSSRQPTATLNHSLHTHTHSTHRISVQTWQNSQKWTAQYQYQYRTVYFFTQKKLYDCMIFLQNHEARLLNPSVIVVMKDSKRK